MLGVALEVPDDTLQSLHQNHGADPDTMKLSMILDHWLKQPTADWAMLIKIIEASLVDQKRVADNIRKFLVQQSIDI